MCKFVLCGFLDSQTREQMNASAMELIPRPPILARMLYAQNSLQCHWHDQMPVTCKFTNTVREYRMSGKPVTVYTSIWS